MNDVFSWPVGHAVDGDHTASQTPARAPFGPVGAYFVASTAGGAVAGLLISAAGMGVSSAFGVYVALGICGAVALAATGLELNGRVSPLPSRRAQVPRRWLIWPSRRTRTAIGFGLLIGSGALTPLKHATAYVVAGIVFLAPSLATGTLIGASYGATRGLALVFTWLGDAYLRRRAPWDRVARARVSVSFALVTGSVVSFAAAALVRF